MDGRLPLERAATKMHQTWKMQVSDSKHVLLIGAEAFSCSWSKQKAAQSEKPHPDASRSAHKRQQQIFDPELLLNLPA